MVERQGIVARHECKDLQELSAVDMSTAYQPKLSVAGHFLSMQPAEDDVPLKLVWYQGEDFAAQQLAAFKYKQALEAVRVLYNTCVDEATTLSLIDDVLKGVQL